MVRQALVALPELEPDIEVVAQAADGDEALAMAGQLTKTGFSSKVVIVTTFDRPGYLRAAMAAGASAFLLKYAPAADIAARLHLSPGTVRNHLSAAIQKLGARNRAEAVDMALQKGWL